MGKQTLLLLCFPLNLVLLLLCCSSSAATTPFHVGVVLDSNTWIGNISWRCITMAVDDFYAADRSYNTRLELHLRDADKNDPFAAASSALDLLKNVQVQAIIGPQTSSEAKFVIQLGNKTHVPIISFSAKCPSLLTQQPSYFIRTAFNDSYQAKVLASLIQNFKWREVVPIFEDTDFGNGLVPYLIDAFQEVGAQVPYRSLIPLSASKEDILKELNKLKGMQTRVFVVHMSYSLGFQLFSTAYEAGMMSEGYVWITTYGLTDIVDLMGANASYVMQGVLGIKPYIRETRKLTDFKARWRRKTNFGNQNGEVSEPTAFGLWAYDTVWALAMAAESVVAANSSFSMQNISDNSTDLSRLGQSPTGPELLDSLLSVQFYGMSGSFHLVDGQLETSNFEIVNVVEHGKRRIGYWTPVIGTSRHLNLKADLKVVVWPGGTRRTPRGWEWPTKGKSLRIGIPVKPGFDGFVRNEIDTKTNKTVPKGFCIDVFEDAMAKLPYHVEKEYVPYADSKGNMNGTYDNLVYEVFLKNFDAVVGDITILANRSLYVDFTLPYTESGVYMLVPVKDQRQKNAWTFLEPLTTDLWVASGAFFIFTGFVVWVLEHRINGDFRGPPSNQLGTVFYFTFSTLVFSHREKILSNLARVVVIVWVFVVLILQQSYTASLTSMLTVQQLQPTVTDLDQLERNGAFVGYLNDSFMPGVLKSLKFDESRIIAFNSPEEYNEALMNGTVAAIVDERPYVKVFLSQYCSKYTLVGPIYRTAGFGFAFPKGSPLVPDLSRAILNITESDKMIDIEKRLYGNKTCPEDGSIGSSSSSLTFDTFWGLFLITGITSLSAVLIFLAFFLSEHWDVVSNDDPELTLAKKFALLLKLYDQADPSSQAFKDTEAKDESGGANIPETPDMNSEPQSPTSISNQGDEDLGTPLEGEGTPGREIGGQIPDPLSFAEMLNQRKGYESS